MPPRPFGDVANRIAQLAQQKTSPQGRLLEARLQEVQQNQIRSELLTKFLTTSDLTRFKTSDIIASVSAIMGDDRLVPNLVSARFKEEGVKLSQLQTKAFGGALEFLKSRPEASETETALSALEGGANIPTAKEASRFATSESEKLRAGELTKRGTRESFEKQRTILSTLNTEIDDIRFQTKDLNKVANASLRELLEGGLTEADKISARKKVGELERRLKPKLSQRDAMLKQLGVPETPESKELERIIRSERNAFKQFRKLSGNSLISGRMRSIRKAFKIGTVTKESAVDTFVRLFTESINRGSISIEQMALLAEEFSKTL